MQKGIAIQTILLLVIGIFVVGILVYLMYRYTSGTTIDCAGCQAKFINWCTLCTSGATTKSCSNDWRQVADGGECPPNLGGFMTEDLFECADKCGLHSKANDGGYDGVGYFLCGTEIDLTDPDKFCIYCGAANAQNDCKKVGIG